MSNNIRTISLLPSLEITSYNLLDSINLYLEVSKKNDDNNTVETYKLDMKKFLDILFKLITNTGDDRWVTCRSEHPQTINSKKTFADGVIIGSSSSKTDIRNDGQIHTNQIIEGTARKAYWA